MKRHRPFILSADPRPEKVQDLDDPRPEKVQDLDDPRPEKVQDLDDPRPEKVQDLDDPDVAYALKLLQQSLSGDGESRPDGDGTRGRPLNVEPAGAAAQYSGFIIVRLSEHLDLARADSVQTLTRLAKKLKLEGLAEVLDQHGLSSLSSRLVDLEESDYRPDQTGNDDCHPPDPRTLRQLEAEAAASDLPPLNSLASYWRIDVRSKLGDAKPGPGELRLNGWQPGHLGTLEKILQQLNELDEVSRAYRELAVSDPQLPGSSRDFYSGIQEYRERAPVGIDARWAWNQPDGRGAGVGFVDLEQGWIPAHEDLASRVPTLIHGDNRHGVGLYRGHHGTAVLSIVVAADNDVGVMGIAPDAGPVGLVSHFDATANTSLNVANAIRQAIPRMQAGDVLLLEVQRSLLPTEVDDADLDAIRLAVAHGIIVVEAAGNGEADLDRYIDEYGDLVLNRRGPTFRESGAIMVAAARAARPHPRFAGPVGVGSNYGSRIDCFGHGDLAVSAGYGRLDFDAPADPETAARRSYTDDFGGTSAAAPIIAGAALVVQGMYKARTGYALTPWEMRDVLSDPANGTPQGAGVGGHIGVMPDLKWILRDRLHLVPGLYLRDHLGDTGALPARTRIAASPDVIVLDQQVTDPAAAFGEKSGTAGSYLGRSRCTPGVDCYIYLRMKNRGLVAAPQPAVTLYWSEVATLVTPDMWNPISPSQPRVSLAGAEVPAGDTLVVSGPIHWPGAEIDAAARNRLLHEDPRTPRHYCFTAILEDPHDELVMPPSRPPYFDWRQFRDFQRNHNNIACHNVHRVEQTPTPSQAVELPFLWSGTPDLARTFDFEIIQRLPAGARVELDVPPPLAARLGRRRNWTLDALADRTRARLRLPAQPRIEIPRVRLVAEARFPCVFRVYGEGVSRGHRLSVRQLLNGDEVGRVVWRF